MSKWLEIPSRKMVGAFAGVGALVEGVDGVVKINNLEKWSYIKKKIDDEECQISDNRLIKRLRSEKGFPKLRILVSAPVNTANDFGYNSKPADPEAVASAQYFPEWMFCSKCSGFKKMWEWLKGWKEAIAQYEPGKANSARELFMPPKCYHCYSKASRDKKGKRDYKLTQVRFIMTSSDGKIRDVPWDRWITFKEQSTDEQDGAIDLANWNRCCGNPDLDYNQGDFEDLAGISIRCASCRQHATLSGLFGLTFSSEDSKHRYKTVVRSSNSVYYPLLVRSLYLPHESNISDADQRKIDRWREKKKTIDHMLEELDGKYSKEHIEQYINSSNVKTLFEREAEFRKQEYEYLLQKEQSIHNEFIFKHQPPLSSSKIEKLVAVSRLKITTVQTGYTRQQPIDIDLFLGGDPDQIKPRYTSSQAKNTEYLLGAENYGEGIFFTISPDVIQKYIEETRSLLEGIYKKVGETPLFRDRFSGYQHLGRYIFVHTLCHLLMKELEFSCGYPTVSLSERLFVDNKNMQGALIYTVGGMEGSYGGLVSQAQPDEFANLLDCALERAEDCASDPICYRSEGQGVGEMNLAACYSCVLIAENACEGFNSFLDRKIREYL